MNEEVGKLVRRPCEQSQRVRPLARKEVTLPVNAKDFLPGVKRVVPREAHVPYGRRGFFYCMEEVVRFGH